LKIKFDITAVSLMTNYFMRFFGMILMRVNSDHGTTTPERVVHERWIINRCSGKGARARSNLDHPKNRSLFLTL